MGYKEPIKAVLEKATQPLGVEKIRTLSKLKGWNTTLANCLELKMDGEIEGLKTQIGWVFWAKKDEGEKSP